MSSLLRQVFKEIQVEIRSKLAVITLNRPKKYNAISATMYIELTHALRDLAEDEEVSITAVTGAGDYYCAGTDLQSSLDVGNPDMRQAAMEANQRVRNLIAAFIDHPKILVAVVNGPAIGISVTTLGLFDIVYCADNATFQTPFSRLGLVAEGCSSYTFPLIMGPSKANQMLLFNYKMTAKEAKEVGLVAEIYSKDQIKTELWPLLENHANELPMKSLIYSKRLIRHFNRTELHEANRNECDRLLERFQSEDAMNAILKFMSRKSKM